VDNSGDSFHSVRQNQTFLQKSLLVIFCTVAFYCFLSIACDTKMPRVLTLAPKSL
jgi:hypothetical protein